MNHYFFNQRKPLMPTNPNSVDLDIISKPDSTGLPESPPQPAASESAVLRATAATLFAIAQMLDSSANPDAAVRMLIGQLSTSAATLGIKTSLIFAQDILAKETTFIVIKELLHQLKEAYFSAQAKGAVLDGVGIEINALEVTTFQRVLGTTLIPALRTALAETQSRALADNLLHEIVEIFQIINANNARMLYAPALEILFTSVANMLSEQKDLSGLKAADVDYFKEQA
jgi:hypothetical protein